MLITRILRNEDVNIKFYIDNDIITVLFQIAHGKSFSRVGLSQNEVATKAQLECSCFQCTKILKNQTELA